MLLFCYLCKANKKKKNHKKYKYYQLNKRKEGNSITKALCNIKKLFEEENDLDIEKFKVVTAKILGLEALYKK